MNVRSSFGDHTLIAIIAIAMATATACDKGDTTDPKCQCPNGTVHTDAPCACDAKGYDCNCTYDAMIHETTLSMRDGVRIIVKYSYLTSSGAPAWLDTMQTRFDTMSNSPGGTASSECVNRLIAAGGEFIIQVEDSTDGFQKVDSTTLSVGKDWLEDLSNITVGNLRTAFDTMLLTMLRASNSIRLAAAPFDGKRKSASYDLVKRKFNISS